MKKVTRLAPEAIIEAHEVHIGIVNSVGMKTGKAVTFAVVDETGAIVKSSQDNYEIYSTRKTAQKVADWYNQSR